MAYRDLVLADGATHYWRLNELSGTTAADLGTAPAPGTISGGVTLGAAGALADGDKAMTFNGSTGKMATAANVSIPATVTIELWFKTTFAGGTVLPMLSNRPPGTAGLFLGISTAPRTLFVYDAGAAQGVTVVNDGLWHHAVVVITPLQVFFYLDGRLDAIVAFTTRPGAENTPLNLGYDQPNAQYWTSGLDEVAIYPAVLTTPQIVAHYRAGKTAPALWPARTWTSGESVTTQMMNDLRDQLNELHAQVDPAFGTWVDVAFQASNFFASGITWGVVAGNISYNRYMRLGKLVVWHLNVHGTTLTGPTSPTLTLVPPVPAVRNWNTARATYAWGQGVNGVYNHAFLYANAGNVILQAVGQFVAGAFDCSFTLLYETS